MEQKKPISHFVAGLITAGILIAYSLITSMLTGGKAGPGGGWILYLVIIASLCLFINLYGNAKGNYESFGNLFAYGFKTTAILTLVFIIFIIALSFIMPEMKEQSLEVARQEMEKQNKLSDEDIDKSIDLVSKYYWAFMIGSTVLGFIIIGAIGSLLGAAITKKRPYNPLTDQFEGR
jgi:hypothetical protein